MKKSEGQLIDYRHKAWIETKMIDDIDIEANLFAMALLMPEQMLKNEIRKHSHFKFGLTDSMIEYLAKLFQVNEAWLMARLHSLRLWGCNGRNDFWQIQQS